MEATAPDLTSDIPDGEEMREDMLQEEDEENEEDEEMLEQLLTQYDNWERAEAFGSLPDCRHAYGQLARLPARTKSLALYPSPAAPTDVR